MIMYMLMMFTLMVNYAGGGSDCDCKNDEDDSRGVGLR